jgi:outer membrane protein insertion porin family
MKNKIIVLLTSLATMFCNTANDDAFEGKFVAKIEVQMQHGEIDSAQKQKILGQLRTKENDLFHQDTFDKDIKVLYQNYEWVDPQVTRTPEGELAITIQVRPRPNIKKINVTGNSIKAKKLLKEAELKKGVQFNQKEFYKALNKIRDYYIKSGYFEVEVSYSLETLAKKNDVALQINIKEGRQGYIDNIVFEGFNKKERSHILDNLTTKKYNYLISWLTGRGLIKEDMIEHDKATIIEYIQNQGYADAYVAFNVVEKGDRFVLEITLERGELYHISHVSIEGVKIKQAKDVESGLAIKDGSIYSPEMIKQDQERIQKKYAKDGYIDTNISYNLILNPSNNTFTLIYTVDESRKFRIGLIKVSGNRYTQKKAIYNRIDLIPGEVFNENKLKSTQAKLMGTGYFSNVNVYAMPNENDMYTDSEYRDVKIEVQEKTSGNFAIGAGFNSTNSVNGTIDFTETNFNLAGLTTISSEGASNLKGGGEFLSLKAGIGPDSQNYTLSWMNPYLADTLWRFGTDLNYKRDAYTANKYIQETLGGAITASYPLSPFFSYGLRMRLKNDKTTVLKGAPPLESKITENNGFVTAAGLLFNYDSTDNIFSPHRGIRSNFEVELANIDRKVASKPDFLFARYSYLNAYYYPLTTKSTIKFRGDVRFEQALRTSMNEDFPMSERFKLGGENTVRGYNPGRIGPLFSNNDPMGGISSLLMSIEYNYNLIPRIDAFTFVDSGAISGKMWSVGNLQSTYGAGLRMQVTSAIPMVIGLGYPIDKPKNANGERNNSILEPLFFNMSGQF